MRNHISLLVLTSFVTFGASCAAEKPEAKGQPDYRLVATIKDIMDAQVDPSAEFIWQSVSTMVTPTGSITKAPRNPEEWKEVRRRAVTLLEATNLLMMPGRRVAQPGEKSANPSVELEPEAIEALISKDRESWNKHLQELYDSTMKTLKMIDNKDADGLFNISNEIDTACENCHKQYWYPNDPGPPAR